MGRLFGTDGARGVANTELTCELAMNIGRAAALVLAAHSHTRPKILIGKDTRISSDMLENALVAGLCSVGADAVLVGVVPTPATAFLIRELGADAGVMISASHNPCEYNGLKLFDRNGYKLPDALEEEIEGIVLDGAREYPVPTGGDLGRVILRPDGVSIYTEHIISTTDERFDGMKIALDCANGSASMTAENLFTRLGAECHMLSDQPDGVNINDRCGSTHLEQLREFVKTHGCDAGLAFDGDADRAAGCADRRDRLFRRIPAFEVECQMVAPGGGERGGIPGRVFDHQVGVEAEAGNPAQARNHRRAEGDVRDQVSIHHIEVEQVGAGGLDSGDLLLEVGEITGQNRRGNQNPVGRQQIQIFHDHFPVRLPFPEERSGLCYQSNNISSRFLFYNFCCVFPVWFRKVFLTDGDRKRLCSFCYE